MFEFDPIFDVFPADPEILQLIVYDVWANAAEQRTTTIRVAVAFIYSRVHHLIRNLKMFFIKLVGSPLPRAQEVWTDISGRRLIYCECSSAGSVFFEVFVIRSSRI